MNGEALSAFQCGVYCVEKGRGRKLCYPTLFYSPKQLGIFYFCHHSYQHEYTHITTLTKTTETCILPANPKISLSGLIITRYSKEILGLKSWYIILYYLLLQGASLLYSIATVLDTLLLASILAYFKSDMCQWYAYIAVFIERVIHCYWQAYLVVQYLLCWVSLLPWFL